MADPHSSTPSKKSEQQPSTSPAGPGRRDVLTAATATVVGLVLALFPFAAGAMVFLDPVLRRKEETPGGDSDGAPGKWLRITNLSAIPSDGTPVQFAVIDDLKNAWNLQPNQPIGAVYLRRIVGETESTPDGAAPEIEAFNAICPHAGCFVAYQGDSETYLCPCHNSSFALDGEKIDKPGAFNPSPRPMDRLTVDETRVAEDNEVWVRFVNYYPGQHEQVPK
ncbi:MAG: Rieske 2Fe-2S domain-containing protein [Pirellulaceae bacterium]